MTESICHAKTRTSFNIHKEAKGMLANRDLQQEDKFTMDKDPFAVNCPHLTILCQIYEYISHFWLYFIYILQLLLQSALIDRHLWKLSLVVSNAEAISHRSYWNKWNVQISRRATRTGCFWSCRYYPVVHFSVSTSADLTSQMGLSGSPSEYSRPSRYRTDPSLTL